MESILGPTAPAIAPAPLQPAPEAERKKPGLAFLLSLLLPGAGHIYCGKRTAGFFTLVFFAGSLAGVLLLPATSMFWGPLLRAALVLYAYGFLDAFYTAREINAGMAQFIVGNNPRIAAVLNLLTNGFGYFYLGERKKGLICFFALRILTASAQRTPGEVGTTMQVVFEFILAVLALDAWRLARKQLREAFPEANLDPFATSEGLSAVVPAALAALFLFNYTAVVVLGLAMPRYGRISQEFATVQQNGEASRYANAQYGVEMATPAGWQLDNQQAAIFANATKYNGGCSAEFLAYARLPVGWPESYVAGVKSEITEANPQMRWVSEKPAQLGGQPAYEISFMANIRGVDVRQNYLIAPRRLSVFTLIETMGVSFTEDCAPDFESIRRNIKLP